MKFDITLIRLGFTAALVLASFYLCPLANRPLLSALAGFVLAVLIIFFEIRIRKASVKTLIGGALGLYSAFWRLPNRCTYLAATCYT